MGDSEEWKGPAIVIKQDTSSDVYTKAVISLLLLCLVICTFYPLLKVGYVTNDDVELHLWSFSTSGDIMQFCVDKAREKGKFFNIWAYMLRFIPFLVHHFLYYKLISLGSLLLSIFLFIWCVRVYINSSYFTVFLMLFYLATIQNSWEHNLLVSYPLHGTLTISCVFISFILAKKYSETLEKKYYVLSVVVFTLTCFWTEYPLFYFPLFLIMSYYHVSGEKGDFREKAARVFHLLLPYAIGIAISVFFYISFQCFFPSEYEGNKIAQFSPAPVFKVIYQFTVASLPLYVYLHYGGLFKAFNPGAEGYSHGLIQVIQNAQVEWIIKSIIVLYLAYIVLRKREGAFTFKSMLAALFVALNILFLQVLPHALTHNYPSWVVEKGVTGYTINFYAFFGSVLFFSTLITWFNQLLSSKETHSKMYAVLISLSLATMSLVTDYSNFYVSASQVQTRAKFDAIKHLLNSEEFKSVEEGSTIWAPPILRFSSILMITPQNYEKYIKFVTGKKVKVISEYGELAPCVSGPGTHPLYYIDCVQKSKEPDQYVIFSKVNRTAMVRDHYHFYSDRVYLYSNSRYKKFVLCYKTAGPLPEGSVSGKSGFYRYNIRLIDEEDNRDAFVTTLLSDKAIDVKSIMLSDLIDYDVFESAEWGEPQPVRWQSSVNVSADFQMVEEWGKGFYSLEGDEQDNWRWCSGVGEMQLKNVSDNALNVDMKMSLSTGKQSLSDVRIESSMFSSPDVLKINDSPKVYSKSFVLPRGSHSITFYCSAMKVQLPGDSRELVFRLHNVRVSTLQK